MLLLHLSDLHFGNKNRFARDKPADLAAAFHSALQSAASEHPALRSKKLDLVVVTGDVAESGLRTQFQSGVEFLTTFADKVELPRERFVFLPGNHDISWAALRAVRARHDNEEITSADLPTVLSVEKLANYRKFLADFYGGVVNERSLAGIEHAIPLSGGGWVRGFPELHTSVAALNTSEREDDILKGGFLSPTQAQELMELWRKEPDAARLKIIALHHNPLATTADNSRWTSEWLRKKEAESKVATTMSLEEFEHYISDLAGFSGKEHLTKIVKDARAHLVLHGHHHDQGEPVVWPWARDGGAPVLSVGSFGLSDNQLPRDVPLSCQLVQFSVPPDTSNPRLVAAPLVYDGRFRLEGQVLSGAFRADIRSRAAYDQPLPLPTGFVWEKVPAATAERTPPEPIARDPIPKAPALYAEPPYIGSHSFVGRASQLETLRDWASEADPHPLLLFEAIGGSGKSMLTWEWLTNHSVTARADWAGRFWYSFYEKGATLTDFCRRALAYMTDERRSKFRESNTPELAELLLHQLRDRPWLLILDGLERILVSYHRFDAAQLPDHEAGSDDKIVDRDPCAAINPEDEDLLRSFAAAVPSKLCLTSRLIPRVLLNRSGQPIPGVVHERLPGLRPADAEVLIRACGVSGDSAKLQAYLKAHCDCHPLVVGVLAGLITDYLPDKGNFDSWLVDSAGGGALNLAHLDLTQKRNHILAAALLALPKSSARLLSTLALLSESIDYPTLSALNPSLPPVPEPVDAPKPPDKSAKWKKMTDPERAHALEEYRNAELARAEFERALASREEAMQAATTALAETVKDLERRGLLQYDRRAKRYDLHPVVRGIAAGGLKHDERSAFGQRVVDHFSQQAHDPYEQAESLEDFDNARLIVKALFQMGKKREARAFITKNNFVTILNSRFEAHNEILSIIRPFFSDDWTDAPLVFEEKGGISLASYAAIALRRIRAFDAAFTVSETALSILLRSDYLQPMCSQLLSLASTAGDQNRLALEDRLLRLVGEAAALRQFAKALAVPFWLARFRQLSKIGEFDAAEALWTEHGSDELRIGSKNIAAHHRALNQFFRGCMTEEILQSAEKKARGVSALGERNLCGLRGFWHLEKEEWELAKQSLQQAVALAHRVGKTDRRAEIRLSVAKLKLGQLPDALELADHFSRTAEGYSYRGLAELWLAGGDLEQAKKFSRLAYQWASADGTPFVNWYELRQTVQLLAKIGEPVPTVPAYDGSKAVKVPVEELAAATIERVKQEEAVATVRPIHQESLPNPVLKSL